MPKIKAVIFDFDGSLVESVDIKTKAFAELFEKEGNNLVRKIVDYHLKHTGVSRFEKFRYIYKNILNKKLTEKKFRELCNRFSWLVVNEVIKSAYVKGAAEFLKKYANQYRCFVVSATPQSEIKMIIKNRDMEHFFSGIYGSPRKKISIVKEIIRNNNLKPNEVIYVGDAMSDYEAANANSVNFIAKTSHNGTLFNAIECIKIRDLTNLKHILDTL